MIRNKLHRSYFISCLFFFGIYTYVFPATPKVAVYPFNSDPNLQYIAHTANDLLFAYLREERKVIVVDQRGTSSSTGIDDFDFQLKGNISNNTNKEILLELLITDNKNNIIRTIIKVYENSNKLFLEVRSLVKELIDFALQQSLSSNAIVNENQKQETQSPKIELFEIVTNIDSLTGTWKAENDIEKVMILRGGRGVAILTSGVSISLQFDVQDGVIIVKQISPLSARQFTDIPSHIVQKALVNINPTEWVLYKIKGKTILEGVKKTIGINHDGNNILEIYTREISTEWIKE